MASGVQAGISAVADEVRMDMDPDLSSVSTFFKPFRRWDATDLAELVVVHLGEVV